MSARLHSVLPLLAAVASAVALVAFVGGISYAIFDQQKTNEILCEQTVENREAIRSTWNAARMLILIGQETQEERDRTNEFFDGVLEPIPALECVDSQPVPKEE